MYEHTFQKRIFKIFDMEQCCKMVYGVSKLMIDWTKIEFDLRNTAIIQRSEKNIAHIK